jgi:hypothetical protein
LIFLKKLIKYFYLLLSLNKKTPSTVPILPNVPTVNASNTNGYPRPFSVDNNSQKLSLEHSNYGANKSNEFKSNLTNQNNVYSDSNLTNIKKVKNFLGDKPAQVTFFFFKIIFSLIKYFFT